MASEKVKVALRVRPISRREIELGTPCIISMTDNQTILQAPASEEKHDLSKKAQKTFTFDLCFDSSNPSSSTFANQETVFNAVGSDILNNAFTGYNACIFAYGQTGSGKSYTMMGSPENPGIIPRLCNHLFDGISSRAGPGLNFKVEVSYMEIYNEKVHDLLDPCGGKHALKVREHSILGPYVDGLSVLAVSGFVDIENLIVEGNKSRTVAATNMNSESSRSHAVFTVLVTQTLTDLQSGVSGERVSRISLVDLAGSERAVKTGAIGDRLKEGSNINKSLTTLGLVISKLADSSAGKSRTKENFVPYRDSVLTWLLKDNLGGNSKTVMVATISPAADNYPETLSTLRYADRAKRIVNHAVVNEDPNAKIIRELRKEVEDLREQLMRLKFCDNPGDTELSGGMDIREKLNENEKIMQQMSEPWEEKLQKTERIQHERHQALEKMGISVQSVGISVQKNKYYLVNLNADPSMNEMLVYYLKETTVVGLPDCPTGTDIQLSGLGIQPVHCILKIVDNSLYMEPYEGARCCLNGAIVVDCVLLHHGDRLLWGNNHFFRVNCPRGISSSSGLAGGAVSDILSPAENMDYDFAREELITKELSDNPIQSAINRLEQQHQKEKQKALEQQQHEYEKQFRQLHAVSSPTNPGCLLPSQPRLDQWSDEREYQFRRSLTLLRQEIFRANALVHEANYMAVELGRPTNFSVTLQIPPQNLSPNCRRGQFVCEPAILVKRQDQSSHVWSMEKMDNKLIDMRELFSELKSGAGMDATVGDPFIDTQENHHLIGVANVFMEVILHDVKLSYDVPIISQQGEVVGRLQVDLERVAGGFLDRIADSMSNHSGDSNRSDDDFLADTVTCRVTVKQATGLPPSMSHFVFCQYNFWGCSDTQVCPPIISHDVVKSATTASQKDRAAVRFHHCRDFVIPVCEEFVEHCTDGALSIEVWGHRSGSLSTAPTTHEIVDTQEAKARSLADRWAELSRKLELWVQVQELNEQGEYQPVEVLSRADVQTGGVYQLRQGQQRRIEVQVLLVPQSGTLPLMCETIAGVAIGSVLRCCHTQRPLDSYQEEDLNRLRERWSNALARRREYLDSHLQSIIKKPEKTEVDNEREKSLLDQWVQLNEERNAVLVPAPGSGIPGAPLHTDFRVRPGIESHVPVLFLNLNADDMTSADDYDEIPVAGEHSYLLYEQSDEIVPLPLVRVIDEPEVMALAQWDSSVHDSVYMNRITSANERIFLILRVTVRLSQPFPMEVVLRKRLCVNIFKPTFTNKLMKTIYMRKCDQLEATGVTFEVVSNIPKASEELEDRESLAQIAAAGQESCGTEGDSYIEKYLHGVSVVESLLRMDRLRQSVIVKELIQANTRTINMRKTASVPNISYFMRMDSGNRSESHFDLNAESNCQRSLGEMASHRASFGSQRLSSHLPADYLPSSMASSRQLGHRMSTLHEDNDQEGASDPDHKEAVAGRLTQGSRSSAHRTMASQRLRFSRTYDSLVEIPGQEKSGSSSVISSGYGSQAVSSSNLSCMDSVSIHSVNEADEVEPAPATTSAPHVTPGIPMHSHFPKPELSPTIPEEESTSSSSPDPHSSTKLVTSDADDGPLSYSTPNRPMSDSVIPVPDECVSGSARLESAPITAGSGMASLSSALNPSLHMPTSQPVHHSSSVDRAQPSGSDDCYYEGKPRAAGSADSCVVSEVPAPEPEESQSVHSNQSRAGEPGIGAVPAGLPKWVSVGEPVLVRPQSHPGIIQHVGSVEFAGGCWIGVELDLPQGKNDGSVQSVQYFRCRPKHGIFVKVDKLIWDHRKSRVLKSQQTPPQAGHRALPSARGSTLSSGSGSAAALSRARLEGDKK